MSIPVVIPAMDLLGGRCVRLVKGNYEHPTVYSENPLELVVEFEQAGAERLHVVDLDAARGTANNSSVIESIVRRHHLKVQVAGGIRSSEAVDAWLDAGAHAVVMGTAAVREPRLLERCTRQHPGQVLAALDVRDDRPAVTGWTETEPVMIGALLARWDRLPLGGVILTCIDRDGTLAGPDLETLARVRGMTGLPIQYSGGISSVDDIQRVAAAGAHAVILGKALYEGRITLEQALGA
ncbi:MAG TPA: 1-(5-phosphoribosyl)-5-[(5-phosphoribosylamino)methylideneamino]imidazole-4-carboxamide isomerase [Candidatus Dormibacteraeota bacterium]|nr:1-(5-phosphoribosyl)-5-[(5-phosphoribosylamino)methylideneamino]imidazole-4-carboxamide isomerase [Candidatus Dormibacteraeota bacterium]